MKIAFWHYHTFRMPRGIETLVVSLANALVQKGEDVSIVTASPTITPLVAPESRVKVYAYPTTRYYSYAAIAPLYAAHFLRHQYDAVVVFFADFGEGLTWRLVSKFQNLPLTLYLCYPYSTVPHRYVSFQRIGWDRHAKHILADAQWIAQEAEELFQRPIAVVPVGTDPQRFSPNPALRAEMRREWHFNDDHVVLLNVSALEPNKGTWRVIQAMGRARDRLPQLRFFILGQGADEQRLRKMVQEYGLTERVIFGGITSRLEAYYNMADIFVMLPDAEANSIASHEAMSCGLPMLVSNKGGFTESVASTAGLMVDPDDIAEVCGALERLTTEPMLRPQLGRAGREHVLAHHTWDKVAERFLRCIQ